MYSRALYAVFPFLIKLVHVVLDEFVVNQLFKMERLVVLLNV